MTNTDKISAQGKTEERTGEDFAEHPKKASRPKVPTVGKEETGATESGEEDKGAKM